MISVEAGQMSAVERRHLSAAETGHSLLHVEARKRSTIATERCLVPTVDLCLVSTAKISPAPTDDTCLVLTKTIQRFWFGGVQTRARDYT